ncbi:hypothetical protein EZV73_17930 [Acidaminobacter sp. JC074]|uniref:hypothetical protein n=1 Tax=Acidaminobacter sp. JC074 TaxID=2530199 RepID=UPI001F10A8B1|nr:hypothetical protein [Acidaminobacter sp. JC074]MCH4889465.1 hypothetical protein [Acidaminobacter sp. JC074]
MKRHIILHITSGVLILVLLIVGFSLRSDIENLSITLQSKDEHLAQLDDKIMDLDAELKLTKETLNEAEAEKLVLENKLKNDELANQYDSMRFYHLYRSSYQRENLIKQLSNDLIKYKEDYLIIYGSDDQAQEVELAYFIDYDKELSLVEQLKWIADNMSEYSFAGYPIELVAIEDIEGKKIAHVDLREPENQENGWSVNFFMGSSQGIMTADTLVESFLQKDRELDEWIDGVYFSYQGKRDWITDHDPALCLYTYYRDGSRLEDVN